MNEGCVEVLVNHIVLMYEGGRGGGITYQM